MKGLSFGLVLRLATVGRSATLPHEEEAKPHREAYEAAKSSGLTEDAINAAMNVAKIYEAFADSTFNMGMTVGVEVKAQWWGKRDKKGVIREKGWILHKGQHALFPGKIAEVLTSGVDEAEDPCSQQRPCARVAWDDGDPSQVVPMDRMTERATRAHEADLKKKARATSVKWLKKAAQHGDAKAMNNLGTLYEKDDLKEEEALGWYRKAAERDHTLAKYNVGGLLYKQEEFTSALEWYKKAHEGGYLPATRSVGVLYSRGEGVKPDYTDDDPNRVNQVAALAWFQKAAERGCSQSMADVGQRLHEAIGVKKSKKNRKEGIEWLKKAAEQGEPRAEGFLQDLEREEKEKNDPKAESSSDGQEL